MQPPFDNWGKINPYSGLIISGDKATIIIVTQKQKNK